MIAKIYQLFFQELIRYVTKMTCDKAAAEDIVQETFLRAMEHAEILDDMDERQCRSWLYKTSRNIFIDKVRRESAYPEAEEKTETQDDLSQIEVRQLCEKLPEEERILFIKRYFEGFDSTQLSAMYKLPPSTIRSRLASARRKLRMYYPELENQKK